MTEKKFIKEYGDVMWVYKNLQIPKDWVQCPVCLISYGFINCRVTTTKDNQRVNMCLKCFREFKNRKQPPCS